jgi:universal stress protein F
MKRILVGLDGSKRAQGVLDAAVDLAKQTGAKLTLIQAVGIPLDLPVDFYRETPVTLSEILLQEARRLLGEIAKPHADVVESIRVSLGSPWQVVCENARELGVDLVVVGSHGYSVLDHLIGTTAARVVNHCDRSVLVVRPRAE